MQERVHAPERYRFHFQFTGISSRMTFFVSVSVTTRRSTFFTFLGRRANFSNVPKIPFSGEALFFGRLISGGNTTAAVICSYGNHQWLLCHSTAGGAKRDKSSPLLCAGIMFRNQYQVATQHHDCALEASHGLKSTVVVRSLMASPHGTTKILQS